MQTGKAIITASVVLAATGAVTAWALQPRYSITNPGAGITVRLDRRSGDMLGCNRMDCAPIVTAGKVVKRSDQWAAFPDAPAK